MSDHHCLYQHGWMLSAWCDCCAFDWLSFRLQNGAVAEVKARAAYELVVESWCDEPLQLSEESGAVEQLLLPVAGGWSVEQLSEVSAN